MTPIGVVLGSMPSLLGDIVRATLADHPDLALVAEVDEREEISAALERTGAHVAVVAIAGENALGERDVFPGQLLAAHPRVRLITMTVDGRAGCIYRLETREEPIDEITPQSLIAAVRGAGHWDH